MDQGWLRGIHSGDLFSFIIPTRISGALVEKWWILQCGPNMDVPNPSAAELLRLFCSLSSCCYVSNVCSLTQMFSGIWMLTNSLQTCVQHATSTSAVTIWSHSGQIRSTDPIKTNTDVSLGSSLTSISLRIKSSANCIRGCLQSTFPANRASSA